MQQAAIRTGRRALLFAHCFFVGFACSHSSGAHHFSSNSSVTHHRRSCRVIRSLRRKPTITREQSYTRHGSRLCFALRCPAYLPRQILPTVA